MLIKFFCLYPVSKVRLAFERKPVLMFANVPQIGGRFNAANVLLYVRFAVRWLNKI